MKNKNFYEKIAMLLFSACFLMLFPSCLSDDSDKDKVQYVDGSDYIPSDYVSLMRQRYGNGPYGDMGGLSMYGIETKLSVSDYIKLLQGKWLVPRLTKDDNVFDICRVWVEGNRLSYVASNGAGESEIRNPRLIDDDYVAFNLPGVGNVALKVYIAMYASNGKYRLYANIFCDDGMISRTWAAKEITKKEYDEYLQRFECREMHTYVMVYV